jgi:predicted enzyme related to lactoylglutathione lyase
MRHCSRLGSVRQKQFDYGTFGTLDFIALADNPEGNMIGLHSMK